MKSEELEEMLLSYNMPVFTVNDAAKLIGKSKRYVSLFLSKNRHFRRIERNKYSLKDADIYAIASNISFPSYISSISAFRYYNLITQMPNSIEVISAKQHKTIAVDGYRIRFIKLSRDRVFGYSKEGGAMVADPEKAIVDSLYLQADYSYIKEAFESYKESIDIKKLVRYCLSMKSASTISKLGFLLDSFGINTEDLIKHKSLHRVKLSPLAEKLDKKWGVIYAG